MLQYKKRCRKTRDNVVRFMNSYIKSIINGDIDPMQIYFAKSEMEIATVWLECNYHDLSNREYWAYHKYFDMLNTYIFKTITKGRRMQREAKQ